MLTPETQHATQTTPEICAIVFQMGKVASTAITLAFDGLDGVEAHHTHFLGEEALAKVLSMALHPENNDYFFHHQMAQVMENARITRAAQQVRAGKDGRRLVVLSLTREPFSWFRSSTLQDIEGFAPMLHADTGGAGVDPTDDTLLRRGLARFMRTYADALEAYDSVEDFVKGIRRADPVFKDFTYGDRQLALSALRPALWFEQHFRMGLGLELDVFQRHGQVWRHTETSAQFGIIRYENLDTAFPEFCEWAIGTTPALKFENESRTKPQAAAVAEAFATPDAERVRRALKRSDYAATFGYD